MKEIPLTQGKFALVDKEDYEYLCQWKWYACKDHNTFYAQASIYKNGKPTTIGMHRLILDAKQIDHKDGNGLNNQKENLRPCNGHQNQANRRPTKGTSKYKGVYWNKQCNKWKSRIQFNGKRIHLGLFDSEIEAAKAYDKAAKLHFGEFARFNLEKS